MFKKNAAKSRGHCLSNDPEVDPKISLYEEAENTWEMGKKLGLYTENDDDIVETLVRNAKASFEEPLKNKVKSKRGKGILKGRNLFRPGFIAFWMSACGVSC